jgi:hypothetical protein
MNRWGKLEVLIIAFVNQFTNHFFIETFFLLQETLIERESVHVEVPHVRGWDYSLGGGIWLLKNHHPRKMDGKCKK